MHVLTFTAFFLLFAGEILLAIILFFFDYTIKPCIFNKVKVFLRNESVSSGVAE